jgi:5-methylcytosine-specific restriction endonuclease McrA
MSNWSYHFFNPITLTDVQSAFSKWEMQFAAEAYSNWVSTWTRNAELRYRSEFITHKSACWNAFCRDNNLSPYTYLDSIEKQKLEEFQIENGLADHEQAYTNQIDRLERLQKAFGNQRLHSMTFAEILDELTASLQSQNLMPKSPSVEMAIMRIWFNTQIDNSGAVRNALQQMPYSDYLTTSHWKSVRSAMILAHDARCQGQQCCGSDTYWQDEASLQVHHMTYQNRGNERFEDLRLLCTECHHRVHTLGNSALVENDADWYRTIVQMGV